MSKDNAINELIKIVIKFTQIQRKHVKYILQYVGALAIKHPSRVQDVIDGALKTGRITQYKRGKDTVLVANWQGGMYESE